MLAGLRVQGFCVGVCLTAVYLKSSGFKALAVSGLKGLDGVQEATGISWFTHLRDGTVFGFRLCKTQEVMFPLREDHNPPPTVITVCKGLVLLVGLHHFQRYSYHSRYIQSSPKTSLKPQAPNLHELDNYSIHRVPHHIESFEQQAHFDRPWYLWVFRVL